jgi:ribosomal protein S20
VIAVRLAVAAAAALCLAFGAGCGGDGLPRQLTPGQRADLHTLVAQARTAAGADDLAATNAALARLEERVRALRESGAIDKEHAAKLLKYAALAELKAAHTVAPPVTPAATNPAPPASPPPPAAVQPAPAVTPPPPPARGGGAGAGKAKKPKGQGRGKGAKKGG